MKTDDELKFLDELEAIDSNTLHLVVGGALGARQMHLTPHHGRKSVCHSVSFHYTISFLVSHYALFGSGQISDEGVSLWVPSKTVDGAVGEFCGLTIRR